VYFQPHRYSRTQDCLKEFGSCFDAADELVITDIYAAGEKEIPGIHSGLILDQVKKHSTVHAEYVPKDQLLEDAEKRIERFTLVVTLGAGDITQLGPKISLKNVKKLKLGLIFGGKSSEHEISLRSARNVWEALDRSHFDVTPFYISKNGSWLSGEAALSSLKGEKSAYEGSFMPLIELAQCNVACPILHGPNGEDGTLQGLLEMLSVPYAGCDCFSSAATMDKSVTKKLADYAGLKVAAFQFIPEREWKSNPDRVLSTVMEKLTFPVFVKPVHLGSTIGITRVNDANSLPAAISKAFEFDEGVLVEEEVKGRELEFTVFGDDLLTVFPPGEIKSCGAVYGYEEKYFTDTIETVPQAELSDDLIIKGMEFAKSAYRALGCNGFARVDCFLNQNGEYLLNEINPIPGCTNTSLYLKIAECYGLKAKEHFTELLLIGLERGRKRERKRL
jgi:UDP-N-acetylmuramate--alanine ligase